MIDMNLDFLVNAVVCDYPSLASITFRTMKGEELVLNYWNGDGYGIVGWWVDKKA